MASTPSAPALSAVLRYRGGQLWTRNPPTKRPGISVYCPGPERGLYRGERVLLRGKVTGSSCKSRTEHDPEEGNTELHQPGLLQSTGGRAQPFTHGAQSVQRHLARGLKFVPPGGNKTSQVTHVSRRAAHLSAVRRIQVFPLCLARPAGVWRVSVACWPRALESLGLETGAGSSLERSWSRLRRTCCCLNILLDHILRKLMLICAGSPGVASLDPPRTLDHQDEKPIQLQENEDIHPICEGNWTKGQKITQDKPD